jgi:hypothetical protein
VSAIVVVREFLQAVPCVVLGDERRERLHGRVLEFLGLVTNDGRNLFVGQRPVAGAKLALQLLGRASPSDDQSGRVRAASGSLDERANVR